VWQGMARAIPWPGPKFLPLRKKKATLIGHSLGHSADPDHIASMGAPHACPDALHPPWPPPAACSLWRASPPQPPAPVAAPTWHLPLPPTSLWPLARSGASAVPLARLAASAARCPPHGLSCPPRWPLLPSTYRCHLPVSGRSPALAPRSLGEGF
jgi:hypothetical protein